MDMITHNLSKSQVASDISVDRVVTTNLDECDARLHAASVLVHHGRRQLAIST
jgi:hypothetical protein